VQVFLFVVEFSFLESSRDLRSFFQAFGDFGKYTPAAKTSPAPGPLPASSRPIIRLGLKDVSNLIS
jgi:hypothetical protein